MIPHVLNRMTQAICGWGADGTNIWVAGPAGLGHLMLHSTSQSRSESLPMSCPAANLTLTASARLDNRIDLYSALDIPHSERATIPDSRLIIHAFEKWKEQAPVHLLGDWAFAVWDAAHQRLFIARDHSGSAGIYYYRNHHLFIFASSLKALFAHPDVPRRMNTCALTQGNPFRLDNGATVYEDIFQLPPGRMVTVTSDKTMIRTYWSPGDAPDIRFKSDEAYSEAFLDLYTEAVRCRLRSSGPVAATLSGGLDSGSVAALAARELSLRGEHLRAFSSIPLYDISKTVPQNRIGDESVLVDELIRFFGHIDCTYIKAEGISPLAGLRHVLDTEVHPFHNASNAYWIIALLKAAQQSGCRVLLTGQCGNFTISYAGNRDQWLWDLVQTGRWRTYWHEVRAWKKINRASLLQMGKSQILRPIIPGTWVRRYRRPQKNRRWVHPSNTRYKTLEGPEKQKTGFTRGDPAIQSIARILSKGATSIWNELGAEFGLEVRDPTFDKRIIEFCLGLPQNQYTRDGRDKLLIRRTMAGLMPERILWNTRKGKQAGDIIQRVRADQTEMNSTLQALKQSALAQKHINLPYMEDIHNRLQHGLSPSLTNETALYMKAVMIGLFLQQFE